MNRACPLQWSVGNSASSRVKCLLSYPWTEVPLQNSSLDLEPPLSALRKDLPGLAQLVLPGTSPVWEGLLLPAKSV